YAVSPPRVPPLAPTRRSPALGVSRRTFFNYFPNIEAVVAAGLAEPLQRIAAALLGRPAAEEPLTAIAAVFREQPIPAEILLSWRSEEHTAELQSRENPVCRLL